MKHSKELTLNDYQDLIRELVVIRGFDKETIPEVFTLLVEEVGELAKAIRKVNHQKIDPHSKDHSVEEELADVFWLILDICNRLDIDLAEAFDNKEGKNANRTWA